jgi:hypothetical protein
MTILDELLAVIHSGNAPAIGELRPSENVVDDYYMRLVQIIEAAQQEREPDSLNCTPKCPQCGQRHTWKHSPA